MISALIPIITLLSLALIPEQSSAISASGATVTGSISGQVVESRCGIPISYANVVVLGTNLGAITDGDGVFKIEGVPPGETRLRAHMMTYRSKETIVTVHPDSVIHQRIEMDEMWSHVKLRRPKQKERLCEIHATDMSQVLVPLSVGCLAVSRNYLSAMQDSFPNAETVVDGQGRAVDRVTWEYRCQKCIETRNLYVSNGVWSTTHEEVPKNWIWHAFGDVLSFAAPSELKSDTLEDSCVAKGRWYSERYAIEVYTGPGLLVGKHWPSKSKLAVNEVIDECYGAIKIVGDDGDEPNAYLALWITATPSSSDPIVVVVRSDTQDFILEGLMVIRSIRFGEH